MEGKYGTHNLKKYTTILLPLSYPLFKWKLTSLTTYSELKFSTFIEIYFLSLPSSVETCWEQPQTLYPMEHFVDGRHFLRSSIFGNWQFNVILTQLWLDNKDQGCSFEWRQIVLADWHHQWHQLSFQSVQDSHSLACPYLLKCYLYLWLIVIILNDPHLPGTHMLLEDN